MNRNHGEDRGAAMPDHIDPEEPLVVVVSVDEEEATEPGFRAGVISHGN